MDTLAAQIASPSHLHEREDEYADAAGWGSMGGFGNLSRGGGIEGMALPRVADVSSAFERRLDQPRDRGSEWELHADEEV